MDWGADPSSTDAPRGRDPGFASARSAISALQDVDLAVLSPQEIGDRIADVEQLLGMLASHQVECVRVMEQRGDAQSLAARSTQAWLRHVVRMAPNTAKGLVTLAAGIGDCPATRASFADGRIGVRHAQVLAQTVQEITPHLADVAAAAGLEKELVDYAEQVDPLRLSDACRRLRIATAADRAAADDWVAFEQRRLSVSRTFAGLVAVDGVLDPSSAETVMTAIHAFSAPAGGDDPRTPGQRRADALTEICRRVLALGNPPVTGGERPHVLVTVPLRTLVDGRHVPSHPGRGHRPDDGASEDDGISVTSANGVAELAWAGPISAELVRQIACDATVTRIVLDPQSQPLDVGRSTRVVPTGLRKALLLRDRRCRYPGCDIPGVWCDAHHLRHWAFGGITALNNLILLCGFHHARLHLTGEWIMLRPDGTVEIIRDPDPNHHDRDGPAP